MLRYAKVQEEIERLRGVMETKNGLTRLRKRQILHNMAEDESLPAHQRIQAIALDNRMMGHDQPEKVQLELSPLGKVFDRIRKGN